MSVGTDAAVRSDQLGPVAVRWAAGVSVVTLLVAVVSALLDAAHIAVITAVGSYALVLPALVWRERRLRGPAGSFSLLRGALVGGAGAGIVALVVSAPVWGYGAAVAVVPTLLAAPAGVGAGLVAAAVAKRVRGGVAVALVSAGLVANLVSAWSLWEPEPAPYEYVLLADTADMRVRFEDAEGLATAVAREYRDRIVAGDDPFAPDVFPQLLDDLDTWAAGPGSMSHQLPETLVDDGGPFRLITVGIGDERACVLVRSTATLTLTGGCRIEMADAIG